MKESCHQSVLLEVAVDLLQVRADGTYWDATAGGGGHAAKILDKLGPSGRLILSDYDPKAIGRLEKKFSDPRVHIHHGRFDEILEKLKEENLLPLHGVLADLGLSSDQLADPDLGISFELDAPLDMRVDRRLEETAGDLVNSLLERELADLFYQLGGERGSRKIARAIVRERPIDSVQKLSRLATKVLGRGYQRIHPATKIFQALRIAVNHEMDDLNFFLNHIGGSLALEGRVVVISFHSLEDGLVKKKFRELAGHGFNRITKKPVVPTREEMIQNPRSRSAKLRALERMT